jgi:RNA polymerase sigma-70 factor (ECF subfamily)
VALYDSYASKLQSYASTLVRDTGATQDAVQEVFLRYALAIRDGNSIATPKAWLFRVLRNYILDSMKAAHVRNEIGMDQMPDKADDTGDPEQQYASAEITRQILSSLTPRELECLRLRSHGLRYNEIANVLSIRPGTVAALLSRCSARIQQILEPETFSPPAEAVPKDGYAS